MDEPVPTSPAPRWSILNPAYNEEAFLEKTVAAIKARAQARIPDDD